MSTSTIRLPLEIKARVAAAAKRADTTFHNFTIEAIVEKVDQEARCADFHDTAKRCYAEIVGSSKTIPWSAMRRKAAGREEARALKMAGV